ncbi:type II toxin-antitoxin system RelE/ParE family toxin [Escherichia coli]|nr:type II toxin-antitoxin system RelE/ParE family toxin [Escherichia coli]
MSYEIEWRPGAIEDITALFEYLVENASLWDARNVTERLITATDRPADYPGCMKRMNAMVKGSPY